MNTCPFPIAIMSFNRPHLLVKVLKSLRDQTIGLDETRVFLFQDGSRNDFAEDVVGQSIQNECVRHFKEIFPKGNVFKAPQNLGVALNFDRAERLFFETLEADCALFFEDDLLLSPYYLEVLLQLVNFALLEPLVSYVAAYGDHTASLQNQRKDSAKIMRMHHNWGFALTRRQWLMQREFVDGYLAIVRGKDYRRRDHREIYKYYSASGYTDHATSQDGAKLVAGLILGTNRLSTYACFAKYIGALGEHFSEDNYIEGGYGRTELFDMSPPQLIFPSSMELRAWAEEERISARQKAQVLNELNSAQIEINAADFVEGLYLHLLDRSADQSGLITWVNALRDGKPPSDLIRAFVGSKEYKKLQSKLSS